MKMMAVSAIAQSGAVMSDILEASDWLYSFFSNISYHLESSRWGNRFPVCISHDIRGSWMPHTAVLHAFRWRMQYMI